MNRTLTMFRRLVTRPNLTSRQVAWSFATGLAIQMNPVPLTQALITIGLCFTIKNLHKPLVLFTNVINNPFTSIPITTMQILLGNWLMGNGWTTNFRAIRWREISSSAFRAIRWREISSSAIETLKPLLVPYLLGCVTLMALALSLGYFSMYYFSEYMRKRAKRKA